MVQTRGQQSGDQSPSSRGTLRGVTAEGDAASIAVTSGATLKPVVSVSNTETSAAVLAGSSAGRDSSVSPLGAGSSHTISVSARERACHERPSKSWRWRSIDRRPTGRPRLFCHCWSDRELGQRRLPRSLSGTATQKPDKSTDCLRGSE